MDQTLGELATEAYAQLSQSIDEIDHTIKLMPTEESMSELIEKLAAENATMERTLTTLGWYIERMSQ